MASSESFHPGSYTEGPGLFVCDCVDSHQWRIDVAGHLFPLLPPGCPGTSWRSAAEDLPESPGTG
ncbi:hypothetical protein [Streptomyces sp. NPDC059491]|uniref:hypothetical protein n=1 Tax=Streptomyces sp. NPDC059491 TaxID=3346850 RepID=UPI0036D0D302